MSLEEKRAWAFLVITVLGIIGYGVALLVLSGQSPLVDLPYAIPLLVTIGGGIVVSIVANIALVAGTPRGETAPDQRDREIARLGERVGNAFLVIGALVALLLALLEQPFFYIGNAIYLGFALSALLSCITRVVAYRRGVPTW